MKLFTYTIGTMMNYRIFFTSITFLLCLSTLLIAEDQENDPKYRTYDSSRIRIDFEELGHNVEPYSINGHSIFSDQAKAELNRVSPKSLPLLEKARKEERRGKTRFIVGATMMVSSFIFLPSDTPVIGLGLVVVSPMVMLPGSMKWARSYNTKLKGYTLYENEILNKYQLSFSHSTNDNTSNYYRYLSKTIRLNSAPSNESHMAPPFLMNGEPLYLNSYSVKTAERIAQSEKLFEVQKLFTSSKKRKNTVKALNLASPILMGGGVLMLAMTGVAQDGAEYSGIVAGISMMGAGGVCAVASIPLSRKSERLFCKGIVQYDEQLRKRYGIQIIGK